MTTVGPRGRVTIPAAVQREASISEGDEVIVRAVSPGVVIIETREAIREAIRAAIPPDADRASYDAAADVRALREGR